MAKHRSPLIEGWRGVGVGGSQAKQAVKGSLEEKGMRLGKENVRKDKRKETSEQTPFRKIRFLNP